MSVPPNDEYLDDMNIVDVNEDTEVASCLRYSSNYTESDLIGTGRVLGNVYSYVGWLLERVIRFAFGLLGIRPRPDVVYQEIQELYHAEWVTDEEKSMYLLIISIDKENQFAYIIQENTCPNSASNYLTTHLQSIHFLKHSFETRLIWEYIVGPARQYRE